ncbi:transcriptional regulator [Pseudomonas plecoglossicida]|uniref:EAL domain-containing protein n=2 Tax=Pseudomonas plecoglossicida TaxID=70775 RepID=A0AAD0QTX9_PSEDL|nr:EAL domain-containing protein [Pseudomonas plecoglossicida]EPB94316.1 two-component response regulator [Pseudomonas plecoglossicida NB2011]QLB58019.1 EAL domain-containing protein [Pseudomonas plecoglossicida]GLR37870.1 transcriptional regulator [Pseudomonas plecoglossicida]
MVFHDVSVLVLDDDGFQRAVASETLRQLGCTQVLAACSGSEALEMLQTYGAVNIVLCDLRMEGVDGLEFLQRAAQRRFLDAVIISSALSADLRSVVRQIIPLLGLRVLGDVGKPLRGKSLDLLLESYVSETKKPPTGAFFEAVGEHEMRQAIEAGHMHAYYQPKFNLKTGEVCSAEVLARWHHPTRGTLAPAQFMSDVERCGLLNALLFDQMQQGLSLQRCAEARGHRLNLAFNLQAEQLADASLLPHLKAVLRRHAAAATGLTFELTESGWLAASVISLENLLRLRMMGCSLSMDDFGTGFSSLSRLCQLPFSEFKLDASFVRTLTQEPRYMSVVKSALSLGNALGMSVVVEGIETEEQRRLLLEMGCVHGQGYLCARPMTGEDLIVWLDKYSGLP